MATRLKKRLVPKLLIKHRVLGTASRPVLVTTRGYATVLDVGDPVAQAKIYEAQLADELLVLNIDGGAIAQDALMLQLIERLASETFMPLTVGGGVKSVDDFALLLARGADKVSINTAALDTPTLVSDAAARFGAQCVVVSVDIRPDTSGGYVVYRDRARQPTSWNALEWCAQAARLGAGELLVTDAARDGTGRGLNCAVTASVACEVSIPIILSGGCGLAEHFVEGFLRGGADAVAAGTFFCFRDQNPMQTRAHIRNAGIPIRMAT